MKKRLARLLSIALAVAGLDQVIKALAEHYLPPYPVSVIPGFFDLRLVYNTGAAFSLFSDFSGGRWLLIGLGVLAVGLIVWLAAKPLSSDQGSLWSLGLICGGALGNLADRLRTGRVVDYLDFYLGSYHWPAFNLADAAITLGGVYIALLLIRGKV